MDGREWWVGVPVPASTMGVNCCHGCGTVIGS
jgi:hypothetical protein